MSGDGPLGVCTVGQCPATRRIQFDALAGEIVLGTRLLPAFLERSRLAAQVGQNFTGEVE